VIALGVSALLLAGVILMVPIGLRAGDQPGDAVLLAVEPLASARGVSVTVANPSGVPVILGMSLRRTGLRLRFEGPHYVRVRSGRASSELLAGRRECIGVLGAGETQRFVLQGGLHPGRRAELVAVIGQMHRLRTIHRLVVLAQDAARNEPATGCSDSASVSAPNSVNSAQARKQAAPRDVFQFAAARSRIEPVDGTT
jgi:hypothetical protein